MRPEAPYLGAGAIAIAGGIAREKGWPREGTYALVGTLTLAIVASATAESRIAPLVRAIGMLFLLAAILSATPVISAARKPAKKGLSNGSG